MQMRRLSCLLLALLAQLLWVHAWKLQQTNGPMVTRRGHTAHLWKQDLIILFGGRTTEIQHEVLPTDISNCPAVFACYDYGTCVGGTACICSDGHLGEYCQYVEVDKDLDEVWLYNTTAATFTEYVKDPTLDSSHWPSERLNHVAGVIDDTFIVYGGYSQLCDDLCEDTWEFDLVNGTWTYSMLSPRPGRRWLSASSVYGRKMFLFGGAGRLGVFFNDLWQYDFDAKSWSSFTFLSPYRVPTPRIGHGFSLDATGRYAYVIAGLQNDPNFTANTLQETTQWFLDDVWIYDFTLRIWIEFKDRSFGWFEPRMMVSVVRANDTLLMLGGYNNNQYYDEFWRFNTTLRTWQLHRFHYSVRPLPHARAQYAIVWVPQKISAVLFSGFGSDSSATFSYRETYYNDTWLWDTRACPNDCNGRGRCFFGACICDSPYFGADCQEYYCSDTSCYFDYARSALMCQHCSNHGSCINGACLCRAGYSGPSCEFLDCPHDCNTRGICVDSDDGPQCECTGDFYGPGCENRHCPNSCSNRGTCDPSGKCTCYASAEGRYYGDDCSLYGHSWASSLRPSILTTLLTIAFAVLSVSQTGT